MPSTLNTAGFPTTSGLRLPVKAEESAVEVNAAGFPTTSGLRLPTKTEESVVIREVEASTPATIKTKSKKAIVPKTQPSSGKIAKSGKVKIYLSPAKLAAKRRLAEQKAFLFQSADVLLALQEAQIRESVMRVNAGLSDSSSSSNEVSSSNSLPSTDSSLST